MQVKATTIEEYIDGLPTERKNVILKLRELILENLPKGFVEAMNYGMIGYVIPHTLYPDGYHCDPNQPLPFINLASQKGFVAIYHMGIYADESLLNWFIKEYPKHSKAKLDMGKSCIRFKKLEFIPYDLIAELVKKMSAEQWIALYIKQFKSK